jgi:hypothetical protein
MVKEMKIMLDSESINGDDLRTFETFLDDIGLTDLLVLNKMVIDETNRRIDLMDKRQWDRRD